MAKNKPRKFSLEMTMMLDLKNMPTEIDNQVKSEITKLMSQLEILNKTYFDGKGDIEKISSEAINTASLELTVIAQKPRRSEKKEIIKIWKETFTYLLDRKGILEDGGHEVRELLAGANSRYYPALEHTENTLNSFDDSYLHALIGRCNQILQDLPVDKGGPIETGTPLTRVLIDVAEEWKNLTGKNPTCGRDDISGNYMGDFYYFIAELIPILRRLCRIMNLPCESVFNHANSTIGTYITRII